MAAQSLYENKKKPVMEAKLTAKERRLVEMVQDALGISKEEMTPGEYQEKGMPFKEEVVDEQPLPKYENIEKLMQEIEAGTNEAAHSYKMKRMKEIAEMLEAKVGTLEEGEGADFVDAKKVKQMKKDIMTLRKQAEKLEKEYDKKFARKEDKKEEK
jgi:predicted RNase H-like nuclease (RuvC/YqgF family)